MSLKIFALVVIFRLIVMFFTETWFVPDEYFQCTEVAYGMIYGKAHLSWEWQGPEPLRSMLHPLIVALFYRAYQVLGSDSRYIIRILPNVVHAVFFAISDMFYIKLCNRIFFANPRGKAFTLILYGTNWFIIYCSSRTMANCVELCLMLMALNWYPLYIDEINPKTDSLKRRQKSFIPYMVIGTISIIIRPTAALLFGVLGLKHLYLTAERAKLMMTAILSVSIPLAVTVMIDSNFQFPVKFPLLYFAKFNFFTGGSAFFGVHPWYWYFLDGLLLTSTGTYFLACCGYHIQRDNPANRSPPTVLFETAAFYVLVHSWLPHKEHRFMLPVLGLIMPFAGLFLQQMSLKKSRVTKAIIFLLIMINLIAGYFFCQIHQRGTLDATKDISNDIAIKSPNQMTHVVHLMPCYSMPQYAFYHGLKVRHHMLDCTPNLKKVKNYEEESEVFHSDPLKFFTPTRTGKYLMHKHSYIVIYKKTYQRMASVLKESGYRVWRTYHHTPIPSSSNQDTLLLVLKRSADAT